MEIGISELIDRVETFVEGGWQTGSNITFGCMAGTSAFKTILNAIIKTIDFGKILIVDGCRDYVGLLRKPIPNYIFYQDMFRHDALPDLIETMDPMRVRFIYPKQGYQLRVEQRYMVGYKAMLVHNAHLIPYEYIEQLKKYFCGKLILLVDPFEMNTELLGHVPTVTDCLTKQSKNTAFARSLYNVETRATDRKVKCSFEKIKMSRRSIGKIDDKQYITNSNAVLDVIREKQYKSSNYRKNMRFITMQPNITFVQDDNHDIITIGHLTMFSIMSVTKPLMKLRIHSAKNQFWSSITYDQTGTGIFVQPANIITLEQAQHHRFNNAVMVLGEEPMTTRQWYTLLKIANHISIVDF